MINNINYKDVVVKCDTENCYNFNIPIKIKMNIDGGNVVCGVCEKDITSSFKLVEEE